METINDEARVQLFRQQHTIGYKISLNVLATVRQNRRMLEMERQEVSESVIDNDERVQVSPMTSPPYKWIYNLQIESINGRFYVGSGFKIHIPEVNRSVVVTSGHCTFVEGSYAAKITVIYPGENAIEVGPNDLYASPEYIQKKSEDHDYGLILLPGPGDCDEGFGWSTIIPDHELDNRLVTVCGFPADRPDKTMWITGRKIHSYTANRIYYQTDTFGGQSGSPVYTWYNGYWTVLGVHSYGVGRTVGNSAPRFTVQVITRFLERMNCLNRQSLRSVHFPGVYIRCDGRGVVSTQQPGVVNCQYCPPSLWESFYIIPVEMRPSSALEFVHTLALESAQFRNVYIRLDGNGVNSSQAQGGGGVNCQANVGLSESFMMKLERNGGYSFRNVQFPNCYIRMDGTGVTRLTGSGGGVVNCQYYDSPFNVASLETFFVEEHQD